MTISALFITLLSVLSAVLLGVLVWLNIKTKKHIKRQTDENQSLKDTIEKNKQTYEDRLSREISKIEIEFQKRENATHANLKEQFDKTTENYKKQCESVVDKVKKECRDEVEQVKNDCDKRVEQAQFEANTTIKNMEEEFNQACDDQIKELKSKINEVDEMLGQRIEQIRQTNTLYFNCVCSPESPIPCEMDLSKEENHFTCPNCGALYRVELNAYPILVSTITTNTKLASILDDTDEEQYEEVIPEEPEIID